MPSPALTPRFFVDALRREGADFEAAVRKNDLSAPVPSCPGWTVYDLVAHLGGVYDFQRTHFVRGTTTPPEHSRATAPTGPAVLEWWAEQHARTVDALDALDPDAPAWNWSIRPAKAAFWHRRMAHETAVHRWDAQAAAGDVHPLENRLAADGAAEILDTFLPVRRKDSNVEGVVRVISTDTGGEWVVRIRPTAISVLDTTTVLDHGPGAQAAVRGLASDLDLALWGRIRFDVLDVAGDSTLLDALLMS